ncbi:MAG: MFS transporter, partial [Ktedonobacteraceae bacterium]
MSSEEYPRQLVSGEAGRFRSATKTHTHAWKHFFSLWTVSSANYFAYGIMNLALILFASHLTRVPLLVSGVSFALILPAFLLSLPAGALVDRSDRRLVLLVSTIIRVITFTVGCIAALLGFVSLPLLYLVAAMLGVTETVEEPALAAAIPLVVPVRQLGRANTLLVGTQNIIGLLTDPLGALVASISVLLTLSIGGFFSAVA